MYPSDPDQSEKDGLDFHHRQVHLLSADGKTFHLLYSREFIDNNRPLLYATDDLLDQVYPENRANTPNLLVDKVETPKAEGQLGALKKQD